VPADGPTFSPFPYERLHRTSRRDAALASVIARWIAARPSAGGTLATLVGAGAIARDASVDVRLVRVTRVRGEGASATTGHADPHAAFAELRLGGASAVIAGSSRAVRVIAQRVLGGPAELDAPRPLSTAEHAIWALVVAAAIEDAGIPGEVWPFELDAPLAGEQLAIELAVMLGDLSITVVARCAATIELRPPPPRPYPPWRLALPIVVARAAVPRAAVAGLRPGDAITVEAPAPPEREMFVDLVIGPGCVRLRAAPGALEAAVATEYVRRDMALPDDAHLELTVELGSTHLTVRQLAELAIGQIVPLGRPLAGPYDVRAGGQIVGRGELIDIDGELGVRIVALTTASP